jgi:aspartate kinase
LSGCDGRIVVIKIGGSILVGRRAYHRVAWFIEDVLRVSQDRYVVVVSAESGATDALERAARRIVKTPSTRSLDLLWSLGELRSVGFLSLYLERRGVSTVGLNVHEGGLRITGSGDVRNVVVNATVLEQELVRRRVVVVPGFLATNSLGSIVSLGRGGSDLTAVLLAIHLRAECCELIKDVPGYFTEDPRLSRSAQHIRSISYQQAIEMAANGCALVQKEALEAAARMNLPLRVRAIGHDSRATVVGAGVSQTTNLERNVPGPRAEESEGPEVRYENEPV